MDELERFIEFWYGPRKPEYSEPEDRLYSLPDPLRRFYAFAGRWPAPSARQADQFFYTGTGHHLHDLDSHSVRKDGRLIFFTEYQGDWDGLTLTSGEDPPVWISGYWGDSDRRRIRQVSDSLSKFLVTHVLMATAYDDWNAALSGSTPGPVDGFMRSPDQFVRIWSATDCTCPNYDGEFFLYDGSVLVHRTGSFHRLAAMHPVGVEVLRGLLPGRG
jgi:hypothetical protein